MKERPILFNDAMVRAILDGRKTQTRRVMKPQPWPSSTYGMDWNGHYMGTERILRESPSHCPYGQPGDRLWVREAFFCATGEPGPTINYYRATDDRTEFTVLWKPSIRMPRWASRILLEVTGVRVERVQDMTCGDVRDEGGPFELVGDNLRWFKDLWNSINADRGFGWDANPWVWVIEFKRAVEC